MTALECRLRYEHARDAHGMTVEEWERAQGFPPFTVYPRARRARHPDDRGFFMYSEMIE